MSDRVKVLKGENQGRMATVIAELPAIGRRLVYVDGYTNRDGIRPYLATSLEEVREAASQYRFHNLVYDDPFDTLREDQWSLYDGDGHAGNGIRDPRCWSIADNVPGATGRCLVGTAWWDAAHKSTTLWSGKVKSGPQMRTPGMSHVFNSVEHRMVVRSRVEPDPSDVTRSNLPLTWPEDQIHAEYNPWESTNKDRFPMSSFFHYGKAGELPQLPFTHNIRGDEWHTVTFERTKEYMKVWCDDVLIVPITDTSKISTYPHHMCLQLDAIANRDCGGPRRIYVDSVQIYTP